jgi:hypothetical protein
MNQFNARAMNQINRFIQKKESDKETHTNLSGKSEGKNKSQPLADNRPASLLPHKTVTNEAGAYSFSIRNNSEKELAKTGKVLQRAVDLHPQYCQQNNEWYAVHMADSCFIHFQANNHDAVINACIATLGFYSGHDWTTFNNTSLVYNGWTFICTWIDNHHSRYLRVYHADHGYKDHSGKKEEKRKEDKNDRFKKDQPKDIFRKKDPSKMSADEMSKLLGL